LSMVTILSGIMAIFGNSMFHLIFGISMILVVVLHIGLHWKWIINVICHYDRLPNSSRNNFWLDCGSICTFILCGIMGLIARINLFPFHQHLFLGVSHVFLSVLSFTLLIIHISRHWKWITNITRKKQVLLIP
jgi:hypothetical protein